MEETLDMNEWRNTIANSTCRIIGQMDNTQDHTFESANRVYDRKFCCPTIPTSCGGGHTPKVLVRYERNI